MITALVSRLIILGFGTLYPAYASFKAVKSKDLKEYVKWMMYWIIFAIFTSAEVFADVFLSFWFPFYYELKVIIVLWLMSPMTKGASILYKNFVHPLLSKKEKDIDLYITTAKDQGYNAIIEIGSKGVSMATNVIMTTAIKGGNGLFYHLKKSYSLDNLYTQEMIKNNSITMGISKSQTSGDCQATCSHEYSSSPINLSGKLIVSDVTSRDDVSELNNCDIVNAASIRRRRKESKPTVKKEDGTVSSTDRILRSSDANNRKFSEARTKHGNEVLDETKFVNVPWSWNYFPCSTAGFPYNNSVSPVSPSSFPAYCDPYIYRRSSYLKQPYFNCNSIYENRRNNNILLSNNEERLIFCAATNKFSKSTPDILSLCDSESAAGSNGVPIAKRSTADETDATVENSKPNIKMRKKKRYRKRRAPDPPRNDELTLESSSLNGENGDDKSEKSLNSPTIWVEDVDGEGNAVEQTPKNDDSSFCSLDSWWEQRKVFPAAREDALGVWKKQDDYNYFQDTGSDLSSVQSETGVCASGSSDECAMNHGSFSHFD